MFRPYLKLGRIYFLKDGVGASAIPPVFTVAPQVTGTAVVGQTLNTTNGTWTNSPTSYTYQWYRGATLISGATNSTYVLVSADAGQNIKCTVAATNTAGSASADSNVLAIMPQWGVISNDVWGTASSYNWG